MHPWQPVAVLAIMWLTTTASGQTAHDQSPEVPWPVEADQVGAVVDQGVVTRVRAKAAEERTSGLAIAVDGHIVVMEDADEPVGAMSVSKGIVSLAFGFLVDDGTVTLDDPAATWVEEWRGTPHEAITLRHLLSHTSGLHPGRADLMNRVDIAAHAIASPLVFEPGSRFAYNNNAVDFLAVIAERASGMPLDELLETRLFHPLGITDATWLKDERGVPYAAGELTIRPSSLLRVGQMLVDGGRWDGRQILSESWIRQSTTTAQPHLPSSGLLWRQRGDYRLALTPSLLSRWRDAALPPDIAEAVVPMVGRTFASSRAFTDGMQACLGEHLQPWQEWLRAHREVDYAEQVLIGAVDGFFVEGWRGQYLVVLPATRTVAVRMRAFMEVDVDRSRGERFSYPDFVADVIALAQVPRRDHP